MRCIDFEFDGQLLSDHDCAICSIGSGSGVETINFGSQLTLNTVSLAGQDKFHIVSTQYGEAYSVTFQVAKLTPDKSLASVIEEQELSQLMRWLNRKQYCKFKAIYEDGEYADVYYMGTFNVQAILLCGNVIGLELTLKTDAPFGHYEPVELYMNLEHEDDGYTLFNGSDETGVFYPDVAEIKCLASGDLVIKNSRDGRMTVINNCQAGEVLTLYGEQKQIVSTYTHKRLYNDFNYNFIRIFNGQAGGVEDNANVYSSTLPCNIRLVYSPICKRGVI